MGINPKNNDGQTTQRKLNIKNYDHLIAGTTGGVISAFVLHPFDLLKLRFAANDGIGKSIPSYTGVLNAFHRIYVYEGHLKGWYRGATPNILGSGIAWGLYFFMYVQNVNLLYRYNILKSRLLLNPENKSLNTLQSIECAASSGLITLICTNPIWLAKTRLCLQSDDPSVIGNNPTNVKNGTRGLSENSGKMYRGMVDVWTSIYKTEGVKGLYRGFVPGLFGVSHGALQFMAYEQLKNQYCAYRSYPRTKRLDNIEYLSMAALSKIFAVNLTYPFQVIKARLQDRTKTYAGFNDVIVKIWKYEGPRGFFKGWWPQILRVTPATCITFLVYENLIQYLSEL